MHIRTTTNLFNTIRAQLPYGIQPTTDILTQVDRIKDFVCDLQDIVNYVQKDLASQPRSAAGSDGRNSNKAKAL